MKRLLIPVCAIFCLFNLSHASPFEHEPDQNAQPQCTVIHATLENGMIIERNDFGVELSGVYTWLGGAWRLNQYQFNTEFCQALTEISPIKQLIFGDPITPQTRIKALEKQALEKENARKKELNDYRRRHGI